MDNRIPERFPRAHRIVRSVDYRTIYKTGKKIHSERFVLFYRVNTLGHSRLGITVSRKIGCAIIRNRTKRLFREIFRTSTEKLPGNLDIVVNAKSGCAGVAIADLRTEFIAAANRAERKNLP